MNFSKVLLIRNILLLYILQVYNCKNIYKETFYNLAVTSDHVYIGGKDCLIQLNKSLDFVQQIKNVKGQNWLLTPYSTQQGTILLSCFYIEKYQSACTGYNISNNLAKSLYVEDVKIETPFARYITYTDKQTELLTIASSECLEIDNSKSCFAISHFKDKLKKLYDDTNDFYTNTVQYNATQRAKIDFKTIVLYQQYIYFLYEVDQMVTKLGKYCSGMKSANNLNPFEDLPIICTHEQVNFTNAKDAIFWRNDLLVAFSNDAANVICRFTNILESFKNSRMNRLRCPYRDRLNQYFAKPTSFVCYNQTLRTCKNEDKTNSEPPDCTEVTGDFCNTSFFGSVEGDIPMVGNVVYYSQDSVGAIVKMKNVTYTDKYIVVYVGTNTGMVGKIFINEKYGFSMEDFKLVQRRTPVIDIKTVGENVYVMTANRIVNVGDTKDCPPSQICEDCMKSENLFCGWDVLKKSCNKNNSQPFWVPSAGRKCLKVIPKDVQINDHIGSSSEVKFIVEPDVVIPDDPDTSCIIEDGTKYRVTNYTCGPIDFKESGPKNLTLVYKDTPVVIATLNVYKCPDFKNCTECVRGKLCYWCPTVFSCSKNALSCNGSVNNTNESMCPRIDNFKLLITNNSKENVTMYVPKFAVYNKSQHDLFKCVVGTNKYNIAANGDNVTCIDIEIRNNNDVLSLQYNSSHQLDNIARLEVYQCQSLNAGKKCGYCKYLRSQNYKCGWCGKSCNSTLMNNIQHSCVDKCTEDIGTNLKVSPRSGPDNGGTVITITGDNLGNQGDNISVNIYGVECTPVKVILPSSKINCTTGKKMATGNNNLTISVNGQIITYPASDYYTYEKPDENSLSFSPNKSIRSGGRKVSITGNNNYFNDANDSRFNVSFCDNNNSCIGCRDVKPKGLTTITCKMEESDQAMKLTKLKVIVDSDTVLNLSESFNIVENPTINDLSPESDKVFKSGGSKITITGQGFSDIDVVRMEDVDTPCAKYDTYVVCETPTYVQSDFERQRRSTGQNVYITFDNYIKLSTIYYVEDPVIDDFLSLIEYTAGSGSSIVITGQNLLEGAKKDDYIVHIGLSGLCFVEDITSENITCQPPDEVPRTNHSDANIVYVLVQVGLIRRHVGFLKYNKDIEVPVTIILISVLSAVVAGAIFTISAIILIMRRKKKFAEKNFQMELLTREENIRQASREEFADAQMTIRDIKSDLVTSRVPFFDYQTYVFNQLFPNQDINKHPLLQEPMSTDDSKYRVTEALVIFDKLMTNKLFLKSVVQTLENQKRLSMQDKAHFACTLSVAFLGNMRLFYELVSCLLSDMIQSAPKKQHKVLFRRFDSITQRLMVNWLELSLYDHLKKQSGMQLFMLYKATQTVIEKGPIDAVTNHCRNTLAEERLLKNRVECETLTLNIDLNGNSDNHIPVTVLDCDTITQVKHKCITAIYKNKPASEIPTPNELELEWHHGRSGKLILQDKDKISDRSNGMVRLNTLKHYLVKNGSEMALMYKELLEDEPELYENQIVANAQFSSPDYVKLLIPDSLDEKNQDLHQWHLSNLTDEEKSQDYEIGELFLNRLFHTKLILRDYIDVTFEGILDPESLSVPVQYFLCMIDKQAKAVGVDSTVVQSWKSECYATRVWASLISRPQILFDVVVPSHVEPCMDILKQVFIDIFTQDAQNVSKDSSTQKLLFFKDVPEYRKHVDLFFSRVKGVSDQEFWRAIDEISSVQSREIKFNRQATLHQLYNIIAKYKDEIIEGFGANDETKDLDFGNKLEKVSEKMEE